MKLLFVNDTPYLPQGHGGLEWNTHELCVALIRQGVEVAVAAPIGSTGLVGFTNRVKRRMGIWGQWPKDTSLGYPVFRGWNPQDGIVEIAKVWNADKIVIQGSSPQYGLASQAAGIPTYYYFHHVMQNLPLQGKWRNLAGFLACSPFLAELSSTLYGVQIAVVRPMVAPDRCKTVVTPKVVLSFGLQPIKGADIVLNMAEARPDIPFRIIETWTMDARATQDLRDRAKALSNVEIKKPSNDVRDYLMDAKLVLAPSRSQEAWARVVSEAHINGIPVLASDSGGLPDSVGVGGVCVSKNASQYEWNQQLSKIWDNADAYKHMVTNATRAATRHEIQPPTILNALLEAIDCRSVAKSVSI